MKRINNSNFELLEDIIKTIDFNYHPDKNEKLNNIGCLWNEIVGNKISKLSKVYELSTDNKLTIICSDSIVANELLFNKNKLIDYMNKKLEKLGTTIKDIRFDYKKWKEISNE